uniref:Uncharacterized protein n=1 Tax=Ascaris lumbricoides TaxID=6252 RepID=A0A0M3I2M5_ASCLU
MRHFCTSAHCDNRLAKRTSIKAPRCILFGKTDVLHEPKRLFSGHSQRIQTAEFNEFNPLGIHWNKVKVSAMTRKNAFASPESLSPTGRICIEERMRTARPPLDRRARSWCRRPLVAARGSFHSTPLHTYERVRATAGTVNTGPLGNAQLPFPKNRPLFQQRHMYLYTLSTFRKCEHGIAIHKAIGRNNERTFSRDSVTLMMEWDCADKRILRNQRKEGTCCLQGTCSMIHDSGVA